MFAVLDDSDDADSSSGNSNGDDGDDADRGAGLVRTASARERERAQRAAAARQRFQQDEAQVSAELAQVQRQTELLRLRRTSSESQTTRMVTVARKDDPSGYPLSRAKSQHIGMGGPMAPIRSVAPPHGGSPRLRPMEARAVTIEWLVAFADRHNAWDLTTTEVTTSYGAKSLP